MKQTEEYSKTETDSHREQLVVTRGEEGRGMGEIGEVD